MKKTKITILSVLVALALVGTAAGTNINSSVFASAAKVNLKSDLVIPETKAEVNSKDEVIYANLNPSGEVEKAYVVNLFNVEKAGVITDYGDYTTLKNLTNIEEIKNENDNITLKSDKGNFYYQGVLKSQELPWKVEIVYYLDGKEISPQDIAGKGGNLEIKIKTSQNKNINPVFFENYLLQVSVTLDANKCSSIEGTNATIANAGKNKLVTFTVMPKKEETLSIKAGVKNFEMEGMQISAVPFSMFIEIPDTSEMTNGLNTLSDAIAQLDSGVLEFKNGILEMKDGSKVLGEGSSALSSGVNELAKNTQGIVHGSEKIKESLNYIGASLSTSDFSSFGELPLGLGEMAKGLEEISGGLEQLRVNFSKGNAALKNAIDKIPGEEISQQDIMALKISNPGNKTLDDLIANYAAARETKLTYDSVSPIFTAVETNLGRIIPSLSNISSSLKEIKTSLEGANLSNSLPQLVAGLSELSSKYGEFHKGLVSYTDGVNDIANSYSELNTGLSKLTGGIDELATGSHELYHGVHELRTETKNLPDTMKEEIEKFTSDYDSSDFKPVSFVSSKVRNTSLVQFVIKTEKIEKKEEKKVEVKTEEKKDFLTKLKELFK